VAAAPGAADDEADDLHTHLAKDEADAWAAWQRQRDARDSQGWSSWGGASERTTAAPGADVAIAL
jgi:hypothetical protein